MALCRENKTPLTDAQRDLAATGYELAVRLARRCGWRDRDEAVSWAMKGLLKAARLYDPARGPFGTTVRVAVEGSLLDLRRHFARRPAVPLSAMADAGEGEDLGHLFASRRPAAAAADAEDELRPVREAVPPDQWEVLEMRFGRGLGAAEVAATTGRSAQQVVRLTKKGVEAARAAKGVSGGVGE